MKELTLEEFLGEFGEKFTPTQQEWRKATGRWPPRLEECDEAVHKTILAKLADPGVSGIVLFRCQQMDSSHLGEQQALIVGPGCTYKSVAACEGAHLKDLPSERQYAIAFYRKPSPPAGEESPGQKLERALDELEAERGLGP